MIIIGVGAGPGMLTMEAVKAIREAILIYGSQRSIDLVKEFIEPGCKVNEIENYKELSKLPQDAVVLSTGDPMLSGLGYLEGRVIPGISSLQVACARLKINQLNVIPITVHGRKLNPEVVAFELRRGKCVFLLADDSIDLRGLCDYLEAQRLSKKVAVMADLGYSQEKIVLGKTENPPCSSGLSCIFIGEF